MLDKPLTNGDATRRASEWLVALDAGAVDPATRAAFADWIAADPANAEAYALQEEAWRAIPAMTHLAYLKDVRDPAMPERIGAAWRAAWRRIIAALPAPRWPQLSAGLAVALMVVAAAGFFLPEFFTGSGKPLPRGDYATRIAELRELTLPDGTRVTLGAASAIDVDFSSRVRRVRLNAGDAFFAIAEDRARPFLVMAGDTVIRDIGTQFSVHRGEGSVSVAVKSGIVDVLRADGRDVGAATPLRRLTAGQQLTASRETASPISSLAGKDVAPWREGRLVYRDAYLRDIVADVNRYYDGTVSLATPELGDLQLTIAFRADQVDRMLEVLIASLPLRAERRMSKDIVLRGTGGAN